MKILFFPGQYPFCYYYRGFLPGIYSGQSVIKDFMVLGKDCLRQDKVKQQIEEADVIVFQRPNTKEMFDLVKLLKSRDKKIIFENDDSYKLNYAIPLDKLESDKQREIATNFSYYTNKILELADGAIASTQFLADEFKQINPNVCVLKNTIDPLDEYTCAKNKTGKFRVGLIGSVTNNDDYLHIKEQLQILDARGDTTIVIMGIKYKDGSIPSFMMKDYQFWRSLKNIEWHPYCLTTEYMATIADMALDLAIIPREDNYFNRCKSNLKFLEMSLLEIPVLAQAFDDGKSPYQQDKEYLTLVNQDESWLDKILEIKNNYGEYKEKAKKAKEKVLKDYNIATYAKEWVKQIENLCKYQKNI